MSEKFGKEYRRAWYQKHKARLREQRHREPVRPSPAYLEVVRIGFGLAAPEKDMYGDEPIFPYPQKPPFKIREDDERTVEEDSLLAFLLETETD